MICDVLGEIDGVAPRGLGTTPRQQNDLRLSPGNPIVDGLNHPPVMGIRLVSKDILTACVDISFGERPQRLIVQGFPLDVRELVEV